MFRKLNLLVAALCVMCWGCGLAQNVGSKLDVASYFPIDQSDSWTYKLLVTTEKGTSEEKVTTKVGKSLISYGTDIYPFKTIESGRNETVYFNIEKNDLLLYKMADDKAVLSFNPPLKILSVMEANQDIKPSGKVTVLDANNYPVDKGEYTAKINFPGYEDITVPAGVFPHSPVINFDVDLITAHSTMKFTNRIWLGKGVGQVKVKKSQMLKSEDQLGNPINTLTVSEAELMSATIRGNKIGSAK
jgi:hypothetical protein